MKTKYTKFIACFSIIFLLGLNNQEANAWRFFGEQKSPGYTYADLNGTVCYTFTTYFFGIAISSRTDCRPCC